MWRHFLWQRHVVSRSRERIILVRHNRLQKSISGQQSRAYVEDFPDPISGYVETFSDLINAIQTISGNIMFYKQWVRKYVTLSLAYMWKNYLIKRAWIHGNCAVSWHLTMEYVEVFPDPAHCYTWKDFLRSERPLYVELFPDRRSCIPKCGDIFWSPGHIYVEIFPVDPDSDRERAGMLKWERDHKAVYGQLTCSMDLYVEEFSDRQGRAASISDIPGWRSSVR